MLWLRPWRLGRLGLIRWRLWPLPTLLQRQRPGHEAAQALAEAAQAAAEAAAMTLGAVPYQTKALMDAVVPVDGDMAYVWGDATQSLLGLYFGNAGVWAKDALDVGAQLATKADAADVTTQLATKADVTNLNAAAVWKATVGGTADAIALTIPTSPGLTAGLRLSFIASGTNTIGAVTVSVNGGAALGLKQPVSNANPQIGMIQGGRMYEVVYTGPPSNNWRLYGYGDQVYGKATNSLIKATAVGGTANAITVTTDYGAIDGSVLIFKAISSNTSTNVTLSVNGGAALVIRRADGGLLQVGDIQAGRWYVMRWDATGGNPWVLLSSGVTLGDLAALDARIDALEGGGGGPTPGASAFAQEASALMLKINGPTPFGTDWTNSQRNPNNFFTWTEGVRTWNPPLTIKVAGFGSSIDTGAGPGTGGANAPALMLSDRLGHKFGLWRNLEFTTDIWAVGGERIDQFLAQITGGAAGDYDLIVGGNPMNSANIGSVSGGATIASDYQHLVNIINEIRGANRNAMPVLTTTFHRHTHETPPEFPDNYRVTWPTSNMTYQVTGNHVFDGALNTIKLSNINLYGKTLAAGDQLTVADGAAAGVYTVTAISWVDGVVTVAETVPYTGTYSVQVKNTAVDEERVVWPPASEGLVRMDRTGNGVPLLGWATFDETNRIYHRVAQDYDVLLLDLERLQFRYLEKAWESGVFTDANLYHSMYQLDATQTSLGTGIVQYNHPNLAFYDFAYGSAMAEICRHIYEGTLDQHRVIG